MNWRIDCKGWRFYVALTHSVQVKGVHSKLPNGNHFLMWDFDDKEEEDVKTALVVVQKRFKLPKIYLLNTGLSKYWHAYCFKSMPFPDVLHVLASTVGLDQPYFKIGVIRGYFTLRFSPKKGRDFEPARILSSRYKETMSFEDICYGGKYWTKKV